jgi:WD40 repeat protein
MTELVPGIPADLIAIVEKAMAYDKASRYANAGELVADLKRFAAGQLVRAQDYSLRTLLLRWLRRHRLPVSISAAGLIFIIATVAVAFRRVERQRADALAKRNELILLQAKASLDRDPTQAIQWLKRYPDDGADWRQAQVITAEAQADGVARHLLPTGNINSLAFTPDGTELIAGGQESVLQWWDVASGVRKASVRVGSSPVYYLRIAPDGKRVAAILVTGEVVLWQLGAPQARVLGKHDGTGFGVTFSPDGSSLVSVAVGELRVWNLRDGTARAIEYHGGLQAVVFSPDGRWFAAADANGTIRLWSTRDSTTRSWPSQQGSVLDLAISGDGTLIATAGENGTVRVWPMSGGAGRIVGRHAGRATGVQFLPGGHRLHSGGNDRVFVTWDLDRGTAQRIPSGHTSPIWFVTISNDGHRLASGDMNGEIHVFDLSDPENVAPIILRGRTIVASLAFSPDGATLASSPNGQPTRLWDLRAPRDHLLFRQSDVVAEAVLSPDGNWLAGDGESTLRLCHLPDGHCRLLVGHENMVLGVVFSPDSRRLISSGWDGTARVWDVATGAARVLAAPGTQVRSACFSPDGNRIAMAVSDGTIRIWDGAAVEPRRLRGHQGAVYLLAFLPDGRSLVSAGKDHSVRLWNLTTGQMQILGSHERAVTAIAVSRSGALIASSGPDMQIHLWKADGTQPRLLSGHSNEVTALRFTSDERFLISASTDGTARIWDLLRGAVQVLRGHEGAIYALAIAPDNRVVATGGADNTIRLWDLKTHAVQVLRGHTAQLRDLSFSADGTILASSSNDSSARLWSLTSLPWVPRDPPALRALLEQMSDIAP